MDSLRRPEGELEIEERLHPLALIVTQDCDLIWDHKAREVQNRDGDRASSNKLLPNILLCELWEADRLRGNQAIASDLWKRIRQNQDERYHHLAECDLAYDRGGLGFPALAIDFKRVFTVPTDELYDRILSGQIQRRSTLSGPFMQDLSNRFGYYHLRVALPEVVHQAAPVAIPAPVPPAVE